MSAETWQLFEDAFGRLMMRWSDGRLQGPVTPVRPFPFTRPEHGLSLVDAEGHEVVALSSINDLLPADRDLVDQVLAVREFMPEITRLVAVSSFNTPSTWQVETHQGPASLVLRGEEHIRRLQGLSGAALLIADSHGVQFLIRDLAALDRQSRHLLDRFL